MADPLGVVASLVEPFDLKHWGADAYAETNPPRTADNAREPARTEDAVPRIPCVPMMNEKIALWIDGNLTQLRTEAIVHSTNETLSESTEESHQLHQVAGPQLRTECQRIGNCRTGDVKVTKAYGLPCRYVFHTVGPRFNKRYRTAAESALYSCCRSALTEMKERNLKTIGFPLINTRGRNYDTADAAPIILRTLRRFLENRGEGIERIVLCIPAEALAVYGEELSRYFPRSDDEAMWSTLTLPSDIGNANGEPVIEERKIRIATTLSSAANSDGEGSDNEGDDGAAAADGDGDDNRALSPTSFAAMMGDHDRRRREEITTRVRSQDSKQAQQKRYEAALRTARRMDLSAAAALKFLSVGGADKMGRRIVSLVSKAVPSNVDMHLLMLYAITALDSSVNKPYVIVHYLTGATSGAGSTLVKELLTVGDERYDKNLQRVYAVHSTVLGKVSTFFSSVFSSVSTKSRTEYLERGLRDLFEVVGGEQVDVPAFVWEHDEKLHGALNAQSRITGKGTGGDGL
eukprot:m.69517 g.69517  ORF g.69517 m.69517 type:complete len:518 (-) comp9971_c0_seq1:568-2121(-)